MFYTVISAGSKSCDVDIIEPSFVTNLFLNQSTNSRKDTALHPHEPTIGQQFGKTKSHLAQHTIKIENLDVSVMAQVKQDRNSHDLTGTYVNHTPAFSIVRGQKNTLKLRKNTLQKSSISCCLLYAEAMGNRNVGSKSINSSLFLSNTYYRTNN